MGANFAMQQRSQDFGLMGAQAQADATRSSGIGSFFGSVLGGPFGGALGEKIFD
jgi:hypothetical protein